MTQRYFIGLMSGTSLDSVDAVLVSFEPEFKLHYSHSHPLPPPIRAQILALCAPGENEIEQMGVLDRALGRLFADATEALLAHSGINRSEIRAIGSHGQTLRHHPELGFSLQIGDPATLAEQTGITCVADFRRRDLAAGGQGAPLVPAFHEALFRTPEQDRVLVNLGGMANITLLPASNQAPVSGYDTGPGNVLMDSWIQSVKGEAFDANGQWAASGRVNPLLLERLLADAYFRQPPPKSTGRERFNLAWLEHHLRGTEVEIPSADVQATLLELTARSLAESIRSHALPHPGVYLCGGGSYNTTLHSRLQDLLPEARIASTDTIGLPPDWMEAAAFAWFAMRTLNRETSSLASVTGAQGNRILGSIHLP